MEELTLEQYASKVGMSYGFFRKKIIKKDKSTLPGVTEFRRVGSSYLLKVDKNKFKKDVKTFGW